MNPVIDVRDVTRVFPGAHEVRALDGCSLVVGAGELVAVVGTSGSGKSTLLNILGLLDRPTAGSYRLDGADVGGLGERSRTSLRGEKIGFVFQGFELLHHRTALENVALAGLYRRRSGRLRRQAASEALESVGLGHRRDAFPSTLSGGERQRVAIARAIAHRPALLLCDEPTGNLDSASSAKILDLLHELNRAGRTIVMITHDPAVADQAGRVVQMTDGRLVDG